LQSTRKKFIIPAAILIIVLSAAFLSVLVVDHSGNFHSFSKIRVACVGDSITQGTYYPSDLQILLGNNYVVRNDGAGGRTVLLSADKPYMNSPAFEDAVTFEPQIIIIMLGTNDANPKYYGQIENFTTDYKTLISHFEVFKSRIWLVLPPPIFNDSIGPNESNLVQGVIPRIEQVANDLNLPTIDVYSLFVDQPQYFWDGVHPGDLGAEIIARAVYQTISGQP
jgi:lysophospholipase L1-like esterase